MNTADLFLSVVQNWKKKYRKSYGSGTNGPDSESSRKQTWMENFALIENHNRVKKAA